MPAATAQNKPCPHSAAGLCACGLNPALYCSNQTYPASEYHLVDKTQLANGCSDRHRYDCGACGARLTAKVAKAIDRACAISDLAKALGGKVTTTPARMRKSRDVPRFLAALDRAQRRTARSNLKLS